MERALGASARGQPVTRDVTNLEARSQGAEFLQVSTAHVNIGGATLGGLPAFRGHERRRQRDATASSSDDEAMARNGTGTLTTHGGLCRELIAAAAALSSGSGAIAFSATNGITLGAASTVSRRGRTGDRDSDPRDGSVHATRLGRRERGGDVTRRRGLQGGENGAAAVTRRPARWRPRSEGEAASNSA